MASRTHEHAQGHRLLALHRLQSHLGLEGRAVLPSSFLEGKILDGTEYTPHNPCEYSGYIRAVERGNASRITQSALLRGLPRSNARGHPQRVRDLIYLDPPFNSKRLYNAFIGGAQWVAFDDTWRWYEAVEDFHEVASQPLMEGLRLLLGEGPQLAYLSYMANRLLECWRVLKPTGSVYLHCDQTMSHYLKAVMDGVFGRNNFRNEIIWRRTGIHSNTRRFAPIHQTILFYTKSNKFTWNYHQRPYMKGHVEKYFVKNAQGWRTNYYGNVLTGSGIRDGESGKPWRGIDPSARNRHWAIPSKLLDGIDEDFSHLSQHQKLDRLYELGYIEFQASDSWPAKVKPHRTYGHTNRIRREEYSEASTG